MLAYLSIAVLSLQPTLTQLIYTYPTFTFCICSSTAYSTVMDDFNIFLHPSPLFYSPFLCLFPLLLNIEFCQSHLCHFHPVLNFTSLAILLFLSAVFSYIIVCVFINRLALACSLSAP